MPFGLQGAPSTFQRMMDNVLQGLEDWSVAYMTMWLSMHGTTWSEHMSALAGVLKRLKEAGLTAKPSKCHFGSAGERLELRHSQYPRRGRTPLTELTKKQQPNRLVWNAECAEAFEALKRHLCTSPVLKCPDFERPFVLQTDASNWGVGAVLSQVDDADNEHPVAYFSKKLLPRERRYSTIEKECLAIKLATHAFRDTS
eukprot:Em0020g744a